MPSAAVQKADCHRVASHLSYVDVDACTDGLADKDGPLGVRHIDIGAGIGPPIIDY